MTKSRHIRWPSDQGLPAAARGNPDPVVRPRRRKPNPETGLTSACLALLAVHPAIAWVERINTGATLMHGRYVTFGFKGCADVIGQTRARYGGVFVAVETKSPGKYPSKDQRAFLAAVAGAGGFGVWVRSVDELVGRLDDWVAHQMSLKAPAINVEVLSSRHITPRKRA